MVGRPVRSFFVVALVATIVASQEEPPLLRPARGNEAKQVEALLAEGADINAKGGGGQTPLMAATLSGASDSVKALLKAGADTTIGEKDGYTPMHGAGFQGRAKIARLLKQHGLDPLDMHQDGFIGMHRACWGMEDRHSRTVRAFLKMGVDPEYKSKDGKTCMEITGNEKTKEILTEWIKKKKSGAAPGGKEAKPESEL